MLNTTNSIAEIVLNDSNCVSFYFILQVNIDERDDLSKRFQIQGEHLPAIVFFKNGKDIFRHSKVNLGQLKYCIFEYNTFVEVVKNAAKKLVVFFFSNNEPEDFLSKVNKFGNEYAAELVIIQVRSIL